MKAFAYVNARNQKEALAALSPERGRVLPLGGGMDLLALMKDYIVQPDRVVNVKVLDGTIAKAPDGGLRIGAAVKIVDVATNPDIMKMYPALAQAAAQVGTPQIRNAGTVGGNINQRPRCWYFRNEEFNCLKKGGARCFSVDGENQYHAIFGDGPCHIVHPSNLAVAILALNDRFRIAGPKADRDVEAGEYFQMPDKNIFGENVLTPNELLTHVLLPSPGNTKSATYEVRFRQSHDWPLALASVALTMDGNTIKGARVVMGAVAPVPWRSGAAELALAGKPATEATASEAAEAALAAAKPMSDNAYKVQIAKTAVKRAIMKAAGLRTV